MPTTSEDLKKVQDLRKQAGEAGKRSGALTTGSTTFADRVMGRVREARAQRGVSQLTQDVGTTTGQIVSAPADIRARTAELNPLKVDALTAKQSAQTLGTLATQATIGAERTGTIEEVIGAGTNQLVAAAQSKKAEADAANQEADSLVEMIRLRMEEEKHKLDMATAKTKAGERSGDSEDALSVAYDMRDAGSTPEQIYAELKSVFGEKVDDETLRMYARIVTEETGETGATSGGSFYEGVTKIAPSYWEGVDKFHGKYGQQYRDLKNQINKKRDTFGGRVAEQTLTQGMSPLYPMLPPISAARKLVKSIYGK